MLDCSRTTYLLTGFAVALCTLVHGASGAETDAPQDIRGLEEVRHLSRLPPELAKALGWQDGDKDQIGDFEREPGTSSPRLLDRWFVLGGLSKSYALVAIENRAGYAPERFHANAFALVGAEWVASGEWILTSQPHTVGELGQLLKSPDSQALTTKWRSWQHDRDLERRRFMSAVSPSYRPNAPLRKVNINDEEVRQIEAVVHELAPGAIVLISGVAQGCPCEDGAGCSAQVWTAIDRSEQIRSLELSDINDHWVIGPVQKWFLDYTELERTKFPTRAEYSIARETLNNRYPTCLTGPASAH